MMTFLEYLKEYNRQLREDAVMAAGDAGAGANTGGADAITPPGEANGAQNAEVVPPKAMNAMTDNSVLGTCSKKKFEKDGFLGRHDFHIPCNVLSGDTVEVKPIDPPRILKRF
jgi:hypothetical protein